MDLEDLRIEAVIFELVRCRGIEPVGRIVFRENKFVAIKQVYSDVARLANEFLAQRNVPTVFMPHAPVIVAPMSTAEAPRPIVAEQPVTFSSVQVKDDKSDQRTKPESAPSRGDSSAEGGADTSAGAAGKENLGSASEKESSPKRGRPKKSS